MTEKKKRSKVNRSKYKYNLKELETAAMNSINRWKEDDTQETRTDFFLKIKELTFAILEVGRWDKFDLDFDVVSYEYSLYLFERIINQTFKAEPTIPGTRFPLQQYININLKHVIYKMINEHGWKNLVMDMQFMIDGTGMDELPDVVDPEDEIENRLNKGYLARLVMRGLKLFYSSSEIKRLYNLSIELLHQNSFVVKQDWPKDIVDFSAVMVSIAKRITIETDIKDFNDVNRASLEKSLLAAARSSIFLSTVANADFFSRELLFSLDLDSLYRLVSIAGGKTIKVPTRRELDTLIGSTVTVSKIILEGKEMDKAIQESKNDLDAVFSKALSIRSFVNAALESYDIFKETSKSTQPLVTILLQAMKSLEKVMDKLTDKIDTDNPKKTMEAYLRLTESCSQFTSSLSNLSRSTKENKR